MGNGYMLSFKGRFAVLLCAEARSAREQASKARSGVDGFLAPEGPENGARSRSGLDAVAEGAQRDTAAP